MLFSCFDIRLGTSIRAFLGGTMDISLVSTVTLISFLAAVSPGPDFAVVVKNCFKGAFKAGFFTALGVSAALFIHITYCVLGIAILILESPLLFRVLQYLGALYLFYLGVQLLREKRKTSLGQAAYKEGKKRVAAFRDGFLCNLLNPKATFFVLSLFTQFIAPSMGLLEKFFIASILPLVGLAWFIFLSYVITHQLIQKQFLQFQFAIVKVMGIALCLLAVYLFLSSSLYVHARI